MNIQLDMKVTDKRENKFLLIKYRINLLMKWKNKLYIISDIPILGLINIVIVNQPY